MPDIKRALEEKKVLIGDGAMGTMLFAAGLKPGTAPEAWNVEKPGEVDKVHRAYLEAGADWVLTNTFGGSPRKLAGYGLAERCEELNAAAARLARKAAGEALVLGDIGPTGAMLKPLGDADPSEVEDGFKRQAGALAGGGVDAFAIQTMSDLGELLAAVRACRAHGLPVVASMSYNKTGTGFATMMGVKPAQAVEALAAEGVWGVGMNCQLAAEEMAGGVAELRAAGKQLVLFAEPNAGSPELVEGKTVFRQGPEEMAAGVKKICQAGARLVGACCGSTPDHIRAIVKALRS